MKIRDRRIAILGTVFTIFLTVLLTGCGKSGDGAFPTAGNGMSAAEDPVDVDLTRMSSTMVYSQVYDMLYNSEEYLGKTVRMKGTFSRYQNDYEQRDYLTCIVADATACCSQGLEFVPKDDAVLNSMPEPGNEIIVTGTFTTYMEDEEEYCTLLNATVTSA